MNAMERIVDALRKEVEDEQAERIKEAVKDYEENPEEYSLADWEDMFEDRDPFEFL
jgi:hypothetical protein